MVAYTEIDWIAYMQEVEGWWLHGEHDYRLLRGDTGPLVYPAGFLYFFCILRYLTDNGRNIRRAQYLFAAFYLVQLTIVLLIYTRVLRCRQQRSVASIWSWRFAMGLLCLSKRIHSIFVLRLFNDGIAMLFLYVSIYLFMKNSWKWGCLWFSLGVSVKMNVLLFAPGLLLLLLQSQSSLKGTILCLLVCASSQLILGAPFLLSYPESYLRKAFELDRVFFYKWTVNLKFLSEETFLCKPLAVILLAFHLGTLAFFCVKWLKSAKSQSHPFLFIGKPLSADYVVYTMIVSNFVGVVFARTLHYQFYSWYFHALPLFLWISPTYHVILRVLLLGMVEYAFNVFPATPTSSMLLQVAHLFIIIGIKSPEELEMSIIDETTTTAAAKKGD
ncbi:ALG3 protein [Fragilaria crotonensis]|nr:ALG3 protein [Fragilaria crotonensis]